MSGRNPIRACPECDKTTSGDCGKHQNALSLSLPVLTMAPVVACLNCNILQSQLAAALQRAEEAERERSIQHVVEQKAREKFVRDEWTIQELVKERDAARAALARGRSDAVTWAVEWTLKQVSQYDGWPMSWSAGFPGIKAQALIDFAALAAAQEETA